MCIESSISNDCLVLFQVSELKESAATFSPPPAPAVRKPVVKNAEKVNQLPPPAADILDSSASVDNVNNPDEEGML